MCCAWHDPEAPSVYIMLVEAGSIADSNACQWRRFDHADQPQDARKALEATHNDGTAVAGPDVSCKYDGLRILAPWLGCIPFCCRSLHVRSKYC